MKRLAIAALLLAAQPAYAQLVDGVAAIVDKDVILLSEVELRARMAIEMIEKRQGQPPGQDAVLEIYQESLQNLIDAKLIQTYAQRANLTAEEPEIDRAIEGIALEEGVAPESIYEAAAQQGLTRQQYRNELAKQITRMKVISGAVRQRVTVNEGEVRALYDERYGNQEPGIRVRARHILIIWPEKATPEQRESLREIAEQIREKAIESGDFASLARQYSRAPSAQDGGYTTFKEGEVAPEIDAAVFGLPPGEITPVIETEHGLNIFQIVNRFDPAEVAFQDVAESLRGELVERKTMPEFKEWIDELRENRYIEIVKAELR